MSNKYLEELMHQIDEISCESDTLLIDAREGEPAFVTVRRGTQVFLWMQDESLSKLIPVKTVTIV